MAELKQLVRLLNSDLDGTKTLLFGLRKVKGINIMFSNAVLQVLKLPKNIKAGELSKEQITKIEEVIKNPEKHNIPAWLFNRRRDPESGEDKHLTSTKLFLQLQEDIKLMKKIKTYKGVRHMFGLPVRGQRTRSNFRKNKGKGKGVIGVKVKSKKKGRV